jgi:hypothetical protein
MGCLPRGIISNTFFRIKNPDHSLPLDLALYQVAFGVVARVPKVGAEVVWKLKLLEYQGSSSSFSNQIGLQLFDPAL